MPAKGSHLILGLDLGTSGVRALAVTTTGEAVAEGRAAIETRYPAPGMAEQDPDEWWKASTLALRQLLAHPGVRAQDVLGIGLTGQCPTFTCVDASGRPMLPAVLYQDNRANEQAEVLARRFGGAAVLHRRTGQAPSSFYLLPKLRWFFERRSSWQPNSVVVQPRDLVGWHFTGRFATDPTHAACTLAYDLASNTWAWDWLRELELDSLRWPDILPACSLLGNVSSEAAQATGLLAGTPVIEGAADSICAAYGARATAPGILCEVTGTSTCLHLTVEHPVASYAVNTYPGIESGTWCAEVGLNTTGGALAWLSDLLGRSYEQLLQDAAMLPPGADSLIFLPHLSGGERDAPGRQGAFIGLQSGHGPGALARATLEGIAYGFRQRIDLLRAANCTISEVVSCGGGSRSPLWTQIKADILHLPVEATTPADTTALGAALVAAQTLEVPLAFPPESRTRYTPGAERDNRYQESYQMFCALEAIFT